MMRAVRCVILPMNSISDDSISDDSMSASWRRQAWDLKQQAWPDPDDVGHDPLLSPVAVLILESDASPEGEHVVATLDILSKTIQHAGQTYLSSGLSAVVTDRSRRRDGIGTTLVTSAREHIRATAADLTVFSCEEALISFYTRCGFDVLPGTVLIGGTPSDPLRTDDLGKTVLADLISPLAIAHAHNFVDTQIALFPGVIDKLW
jgi:aminoglycoside 2'-N-acetyltransferase I